jgi:hypothetical protein
MYLLEKLKRETWPEPGGIPGSPAVRFHAFRRHCKNLLILICFNSSSSLGLSGGYAFGNHGARPK